MARVAVTCVSYNCADLLVKTLTAVKAQEVTGGVEVVVVDNGSEDGSVAAAGSFPGVEVIALGRNVGFGAGHNVAARRTRAPYLLILNPDVELPPGLIEKMARFLDGRPDAAAAGPKVVGREGRLQRHCARRFPTLWHLACQTSFLGGTRWAGSGLCHKYYRRSFYERGPSPAEVLTGACMMVRREAWDAIGGFDEGYFLYSEDVDICRAFRREGMGLWYLPWGPARHFTGGSRRAPRPFVLAAAYASAIRYARKWHGPAAARFLALWVATQVRAAQALSGVMGLVSDGARERARFYREVLRSLRGGGAVNG